MEEINLEELLLFFKKKILIIIAFVIVSVLAMVSYLVFLKVPVYTSSTTIILTSDDSVNGGITSNDISLNKSLVGTYAEVMKSKKVLNQVIYNLDLDITYNELAGQINVSNVADTELLKIEVTSPSAKDAMQIANSITIVFSNEIKNIYSIENVSVVDKAERSKAAANAGVTKELTLSIAIGIVLSSVILLLMYYFDKKVRTKEEIERITSLPILGLIPIDKEEK